MLVVGMQILMVAWGMRFTRKPKSLLNGEYITRLVDFAPKYRLEQQRKLGNTQTTQHERVLYRTPTKIIMLARFSSVPSTQVREDADKIFDQTMSHLQGTV